MIIKNTSNCENFSNKLVNQTVYINNIQILNSISLEEYLGSQGSVLGPKLFILSMNNIIPSNNISKIVLFANDTSLAITAPRSEEL